MGVDLQPWMGQVGIAAASVGLFIAIGRSYINSISNRVKEVREQHAEHLKDLTASWEARLLDMRTRAEAWEAAATRREESARELAAGMARMESAMTQNLALLTAIRQGQPR